MSSTSCSPLFVVGMNGSGTTMLADSLGRHPDLYVFPRESKVLPYFISRASRYGDLGKFENRRRLADDIGAAKPYWHANNKARLVIPGEALSRGESVGDVISSIYMYMAGRQGKARWVDKSPANTHYIGELARTFPTAQFVHIIRDGRDAAQSFNRRWGYNAYHTMYRWKRTVRMGREQGAVLGPARYLEVLYEDLTANPESVMRLVCGFLGLKFADSILASSMKFMDPSNANADSGRIVANSGKFRDYFTGEQLRQMEEIGGRQLAELGYAATLRGDRDLSELCLWKYRLHDAFTYTRSFFAEYGWGAFPSYAKGLSASLKQWLVSRH